MVPPATPATWELLQLGFKGARGDAALTTSK